MHRRPERLRQDDVAALHRRPDRHSGRHTRWSTASRSPARPRRRDGVPAFRPAAVEDRATTTPPSASRWRVRRAARIKERVAHYLDLVGLTGFEHHYPYQLSGGMQQRVGLVRALAIDPVDPADGRAVRGARRADPRDPAGGTAALMQRPDERKTMVFITHSIDEAILLGDRIAVMTARPGRVKEILDVPFRRPRDVDAVRADPRFAELRAHIWNELRAARPRRRRSRDVASGRSCRCNRAPSAPAHGHRGRRRRRRAAARRCTIVGIRVVSVVVVLALWQICRLRHRSGAVHHAERGRAAPPTA